MHVALCEEPFANGTKPWMDQRVRDERWRQPADLLESCAVSFLFLVCWRCWCLSRREARTSEAARVICRCLHVAYEWPSEPSARDRTEAILSQKWHQGT